MMRACSLLAVCICALGCTEPLVDGTIACTPGLSGSCPDGWRCRQEAPSDGPRCYRNGPEDVPRGDAGPDALDADPIDAADARASDAADARAFDAADARSSDAADARAFDAADARSFDASDAVSDVADIGTTIPGPEVGPRDALPPDGFSRSTCRPEWERLLEIAHDPADLGGPWCEIVNNPDDHLIGYCGYETSEECQCNWLGHLRDDFHCEPRPELHCFWARRCGSPHDDPSQRRIVCLRHADECIDLVRSWSACDLVLLTPDTMACGGPGEVPPPTSGESAVPVPGCCAD